jgi:hypothetical protein
LVRLQKRSRWRAVVTAWWQALLPAEREQERSWWAVSLSPAAPWALQVEEWGERSTAEWWTWVRRGMSAGSPRADAVWMRWPEREREREREAKEEVSAAG